MKRIYGLCLAIALGLGGVLFNLEYLRRKSQEFEKEQFIGIKDRAAYIPGDALKEDDLVPVNVPLQWLGDLRKFAIPYKSRSTVVGTPVWRALEGPRLLLNEDLKTPPAHELTLDKDEVAWGIPIDARQFTLSLVKPGDWVSFLISRSRIGVPTPAAPAPTGKPTAEEGDAPAKRATSMEIIGPFKVLALGNRLGSIQVARAARIPAGQENVMTIAVKYANDQPEDRAQRLWTLLEAIEFRGVGIQLFSPKIINK